MTVMSASAGLTAADYRTIFDAALPYDAYLATSPDKAGRWRDFGAKVSLTQPQRTLLESFTRDMNVLCISGIWCGDCAQQGPILAAIAQASPRIDLRWIDRDEHAEFSKRFVINRGDRVPVVIFMAEDCEFVGAYGDRPLSRYRAIAARQLGASCPLPGAPLPADEIAATTHDWLDEFERVQLLLRLSPRLRQVHGD